MLRDKSVADSPSLSQSKKKIEEREKIERDIEEFIVRGGKIEIVGQQSLIDFETYRALNDRLSAMEAARKRYNARGKKK